MFAFVFTEKSGDDMRKEPIGGINVVATVIPIVLVIILAIVIAVFIFCRR
jgi:heme/copper-type cytochrome/quinol oxidase subunit 2